MGEVSLLAWLTFAGLVCLASLAGVSVVRVAPWRESAKQIHLPFALGLLVGPFLTGLSAVGVLTLIPRVSHGLHIVLVLTSLLVIAVGACLLRRWLEPSMARINVRLPRSKLSRGDWFWFILLVLWILTLLINAINLPLLQNDSLEYAMVGREIYHAGSLEVYPLLDSDASLSGFFAPWTHPPLYVSLVYLMYAVQGHALEPGLMRLISPWFLIAAVYCLASMGRLHSLRLGLISAVLLISTPLLFLGADSGLLDALPVAALVMLMAVILGVKPEAKRYPIMLGMTLGFSLWTHSQAILLIGLLGVALTAQVGVFRWKRVLVVMATAVIVALLVAGAPYFKNYLIFGSPISDSPLIFTLPELDWRGYFEFSRGLDHGYAIFQYGVLKGWFSLEAYALVFWAWLVGLVIFILSIRTRGLGLLISRGFHSDELTHGSHSKTSAPMVCLSFVLVVTYLTGVVASVLIGVDLMIRNERYMLMIVPAVALGAAYGLDRTLIWFYNSGAMRDRNFIRKTFISGLAGVLILQWVIIGMYYRWRVPEMAALSNWPNIQVVQAINRLVPEGSRVLSMRPSDMYYAERPMVSYLDERMVPFYAQTDAQKALQVLKNLGITHVQLPDYALPPVYNSALPKILSDPSMSRLVFSSDFDQLYELQPEEWAPAELEVVDNLHSQPWQQIRQIRFGGRKVLETFGVNANHVNYPASESSQPWFHRDYSAMLVAGGADSLMSEDFTTMITVQPGQYLLSLRVTGKGYVQVWMKRFEEGGLWHTSSTTAVDGAIRLGDFSLTDKRPTITLTRRIRIEEPVAFVRFGVEHSGMSHIEIEAMTLSRWIPNSEPTASEVDQPRP